VNPAIDCSVVSLEQARRNVTYARSTAARAQSLWQERAISRDELLQRAAALSREQRCLETLETQRREGRITLLDGEQLGLD
jgi:hypothetical protein